jgi:hypothetical protein
VISLSNACTLGVRRIYGYPGDGINGVIGALQRAGDIEFIQVRHEETACPYRKSNPLAADRESGERIHEHIDHPNRIILVDPILKAFRQQRSLPAIQSRHKACH